MSKSSSLSLPVEVFCLRGCHLQASSILILISFKIEALLSEDFGLYSVKYTPEVRKQWIFANINRYTLQLSFTRFSQMYRCKTSTNIVKSTTMIVLTVLISNFYNKSAQLIVKLFIVNIFKMWWHFTFCCRFTKQLSQIFTAHVVFFFIDAGIAP